MKCQTIQPEQYEPWRDRTLAWSASTAHWISEHLSPVDAERFEHPVIMGADWSRVVNAEHNQLVSKIVAQLPELIRLRDEQEAKLR